MGKTDTITKDYMRRTDIFADVFNQFIYHGVQRIASDSLVELDTTEIAVPYGEDNVSVPNQRYRDVAKILTAKTDGKAAYCILAVENESKINYAMPVKNGLYDFMQLARQVAETTGSHKRTPNDSAKPSKDEFLSGFWKSDRLLPVVTLTVYFGADTWDGPLCLKQMYTDCSEELLKYAADYQINLISPASLSDEEMDGFQTSFREVMKYIKYSTNGKELKKLLNTDKRFKRVERQAADVINTVTGSKVKYSETEELIDMCLAIQEIREEGREEGREKGREEGRIEGEIIGVIRSNKKWGIPQEDTRQYIMEEYQKSAEETEVFMSMYWK